MDLVSAGNLGTFTIILSSIGLVLSLFSFIISAIAAKRFIKACNIGQELILEMGILNEDEEKKIKKLYSAWKKLIVINVIISMFEAIYFFIKLIFSSLKIFRR